MFTLKNGGLGAKAPEKLQNFNNILWWNEISGGLARTRYTFFAAQARPGPRAA